MRTEALAAATAPWMPALAFTLFVVAFVCLTWPALRGRNKGHWEKMAEMPLEAREEDGK